MSSNDHEDKVASWNADGSRTGLVAAASIDVVVIQPEAVVAEGNGICRDGLVRHSSEGSYRHGARALDRMTASADTGSFPPPPSVIAKTIVKAIHARRPSARYATGGGAWLFLLLHNLLTDRAFDALVRTFPRQEMSS